MHSQNILTSASVSSRFISPYAELVMVVIMEKHIKMLLLSFIWLLPSLNEADDDNVKSCKESLVNLVRPITHLLLVEQNNLTF